MKTQTAELKGPQLDWAVAVCEGWEPYVQAYNNALPKMYMIKCEKSLSHPCFSRDWSQGGPIIDREKISILHHNGFITNATPIWDAMKEFEYDGMEIHMTHAYTGPTPLIAAMRCYVASKLGEEVEIPEELV